MGTRFLVLYLLSGAFGNLVSAALDPWKLAVGASTSGLGILGATLACLIQNWEDYPPQQRKWLLYVVIMLLCLLLSSHTDLFGHLGGFIGGFCMMLLFSDKGLLTKQWSDLSGRDRLLQICAVALPAMLAGNAALSL